jgi:hypothetical protein
MTDMAGVQRKVHSIGQAATGQQAATQDAPIVGQGQNSLPINDPPPQPLTVGPRFVDLFQEALILTGANLGGGAAVGAMIAPAGTRKKNALKGAVVSATLMPLVYGAVSSTRIALADANNPVGDHATVWKTAGLAALLGVVAWGALHMLGGKD